MGTKGMGIRGEGRTGLRLVLSACVVLLLGALVWSAFSILATWGPSGVPSPVVKAVPEPPREVPPFLSAEEEDSKIRGDAPPQQPQAAGPQAHPEGAGPSPTPPEQESVEGASSRPESPPPAVGARGEALDEPGAPGDITQREPQMEGTGRRGLLSAPGLAERGKRGAQATFTLHVESFQNAAVARERAEYFKGLGLDSFSLPVELPGKGTWHRVLVGRFADRLEAEAARSRLEKEKGLRGIRVVPLERSKARNTSSIEIFPLDFSGSV